ncbi:MAG: hypothetical protein IT493_12025 [Gammaproteobacteria bacterium]|nr:hypothetical protein [Gammaproteobacteria bacterium]
MMAAAEVAPDSALEHDLEHRCENWGAALRSQCHGNASSELVAARDHAQRGVYLTRRFAPSLRSFEAGWTSPQSAHWNVPGVTRAPRDVDLADAQTIETAVCSIDAYFHAILRGWHVQRFAEPVCLRLAARAVDCKRGKLSGWQATLDMAYALLTAALDLPAGVHKDRARARVLATLALDNT